jgi:hypothetical protein
MDILDKIEMDGFESSHNNFSMVWKTYQILREGLKVSNGELDELIKYHNQSEDYLISDKLNKLKTII